MDTSTLTIDDQVDLVLHKIALSPNLTLKLTELYDVIVMDESAYQLDHFMLEKGLLKIVRDGRTITGKGLEIANFGGWLAYQRQLKREKPANLYGTENLQPKLERELSLRRKEIETYKEEVQSRAEKDMASSVIIRGLIEQNKSNKLTAFIAGMVTGLILASVIWFLIFN